MGTTTEHSPQSALVAAERTEWERSFLARCPADEVARLVHLEQRLIAHGGVRLLCIFEPDLAPLLADGCFRDGSGALARPGRQSRCHDNATLLFESEGGAIGTGYALSADGIWRQHSWWISPAGQLVETTTGRLAYFGIILRGAAADRFCAAQL